MVKFLKPLRNFDWIKRSTLAYWLLICQTCVFSGRTHLCMGHCLTYGLTATKSLVTAQSIWSLLKKCAVI